MRVTDKIEVDGKTYDYQVAYGLWQCSTCDGVSLYLMTEDDWVGDPDLSYFDMATIVYPDEKKFEGSVPDAVRKSYVEAKKVMKVSADAFAVLARRTLEQICEDQNAKGRSLKERIRNLADKEVIPKNLAGMADALRSLGNMGAHTVDFEFGWEEVNALDDFLVAVIEYVYIASQKIERLNKSIAAKQKKRKN